MSSRTAIPVVRSWSATEESIFCRLVWRWTSRLCTCSSPLMLSTSPRPLCSAPSTRVRCFRTDSSSARWAAIVASIMRFSAAEQRRDALLSLLDNRVLGVVARSTASPVRRAREQLRLHTHHRASLHVHLDDRGGFTVHVHALERRQLFAES